MTQRNIQQSVQATAVSEGAGVTVQRTIGTPQIRHFDPFLMLDYFNSSNPDDYIAGFPDHPHRGFCTFTYMLNGHLLHKDSMGNQGDLRSGGGQWMQAGSGVIHSEMPQQTQGLMRGFQLWINLPRQLKMSPPEYQEFAGNHFPLVEFGESSVKIIIGTLQGQSSPILDPNTQVHYFDIRLAADDRIDLPVTSGHNAFVYTYEGNARIGSTSLPQHSFATLSEGDSVELLADSGAASLILVSGKPLQEPFVQHGPFVMSTQEEVMQAFRDYEQGTLVKSKADYSPVD